jgi:hypothetical protein
MAESKTVLSIDVGIKNLSYCVLKIGGGAPELQDDINIVDWKNIAVTNQCIKKTPLQNITESLLTTLEEHFDDTVIYDYVIIENQPMLKNGLMKTVSVIIYTYFNMLKMHHGNICDVRFVSATNKLKNVDVAKSTYKDRKKASIHLAKMYIEQFCPPSSSWNDWFHKQQKKDDYADSLNQGIAFIKNCLQNGKLKKI